MAIRVPYNPSQVDIRPITINQARQDNSMSAAGQNIAKAIGGVASVISSHVDRQYLLDKEQKEQALQLQKDQEAELAKKQKALETNQTINHYMSFDAALFDYEQKIVADPNIDPTDYPQQVTAFSSKYMKEVADKTPADLWVQFQPRFREKSIQAAQRVFNLAQKEIEDRSWAEELAAVDSIANNPLKTAREKILILQSPDIFIGSGRSEHEIEAERQKRIAYVADTEIKQLFNAAGNNITRLREVKELLTSTTKEGNYSYLPEMPQKDREDHRSALQAKIKQAEHMAEMERNQRAAVSRQAAQELVTEYREKVNTGWMPNTPQDFAFVKQARQAASASPSLSRQFNDSTVKMTSFASRERFRAADPLGTAAAEKGIILKPLNVTGAMGPQLEERAKVANSLGVKAIFKGDELNAFAERLQQLDAVEQLKTITQMGAKLGKWSRPTFTAAAEQLKTKDPGLSTLFNLAADGDMHTVRLYATGRQFLSSEKKDLLQQKVTTLKTDLDEKLDKLLGTALRALPQSRNAVKDATAVAYIGAATSQGIPLDTVDPVLFSEIKKRIIGETVSTGSYFGSNKTTIIPRGMTRDQFLNNIKAITPVSVNLSGGVEGMDDEEAAKFMKKSAWHELGDGYGFYRDGKLLMGKNGKPFIWRQ